MVVQQKHACLSWQDHINTAKQRAIQPKLLTFTSNCTAGGGGRSGKMHILLSFELWDAWPAA